MSVGPADLLDRAATLVAGIVVTTIGVAAVLWPTHWVRAAPEHISTGPVVRATAATWWAWGLAGAGTLLVLIGLVWLILHVPVRKAPVLRLPGTTDPGFITVNLDGVASAAAAALARESNVQSAKGKTFVDRRASTVELTVTVAHPAGLASVISAIDSTCADIARAIGDTSDSPVAVRAVVQIAKIKRPG